MSKHLILCMLILDKTLILSHGMSEPIIKLQYVCKLNQNISGKMCHHLKYMYHVCSLQSALASKTENNKQAKPTHKILGGLVQKCVICCSVSDATIRVSEWTRGCLCLCGHLWEWVLVECPVLATIKWVLHSVVSSHREDTVEEATPCHTTDYAAVVERESLERHLSASNHTFANLLSNSLCAPCLGCWSSGLD